MKYLEHRKLSSTVQQISFGDGCPVGFLTARKNIHANAGVIQVNGTILLPSPR